MDKERLRVTLEVWAVRWLGRGRTLARLVAILAVAAGGADFVLQGGATFGPTADLALFVGGLVAVLVLSAVTK